MKSLWRWEDEQMNPLKMKFVSNGDLPRLIRQLNEKLSFMRQWYKVCTTIEIYNDRELKVVDEHVTILKKKNGTPYRPADELPIAKILMHDMFVKFCEKVSEYEKKNSRRLTFTRLRLSCGAQGVELVSDEPAGQKPGKNSPTFTPSDTDF